jgi:hypothetical protein
MLTKKRSDLQELGSPRSWAKELWRTRVDAACAIRALHTIQGCALSGLIAIAIRMDSVPTSKTATCRQRD